VKRIEDAIYSILARALLPILRFLMQLDMSCPEDDWPGY
jgi:hypothetical protein